MTVGQPYKVACEAPTCARSDRQDDGVVTVHDGLGGAYRSHPACVEAWRCEDCELWFDGRRYYTIDEDLGTTLCPMCAGPYLAPDAGYFDQRYLNELIRFAIVEVVQAYDDSGNTMHGVPDIGPGLQQLGSIVGLNVRLMAAHDEEADDAK